MAHFYTQREQLPFEERYVDLEKTEIPKLRKMMEEGIVEFSFMKANGDIRIAHGTTSMKIIPISKLCERLGEDLNEMVNTSFYDVDKQAWRSFSNRNFISIRS